MAIRRGLDTTMAPGTPEYDRLEATLYWMDRNPNAANSLYNFAVVHQSQGDYGRAEAPGEVAATAVG